MAAVFVKHNRSRYPDHLLREAHGLEALRRVLAACSGAAPAIDIPEVVQVDDLTLTIPFIQTTRCNVAQWQRLGQGLACIHAQPQSRFGFAEDNYIGLNPQPNGFSDSWGQFFLRQRLEFQVGLITQRQRRQEFSASLHRHRKRLKEFLDSDALAPSLVHGDLWNGNVLCGGDERVWLIDPAVYHGDAEVDLAMTDMFGGFPDEFYSAYRALRPEPPNWTFKKSIYDLYHYLNHLNLFGEGYLGGCEAGFEIIEKL